MAGLITLAEDGEVEERVTLDAEDARLLAWAVRQVAARAKAIGASDAVVARLERTTELIERVARRSDNVGHDVGTHGDRLADSALLTPKQLQTLLNVSERTARRKCDVKIGGRRFIAREKAEAMRCG